MATSVPIVTQTGKRHVARASPMVPLRVLLQQACEALRLGDPEQFGLRIVTPRNNAPLLVLDQPVRFANLPPGAKLEIVAIGAPEPLPASPRAPMPPNSEKPQEFEQPAQSRQPVQSKQPESSESTQRTTPIQPPKAETIRVFRAPGDDQTQAWQIDVPDSHFELTPAELQAVLAEQARARRGAEDRPLMTSAMRAREQESRRKQYPRAVVRVRLPDRMTLQFELASADTVATLYQRVAQQLADPERPFRLFSGPPMRSLDDRKESLYDASLAPAALVHFAWADGTAGPSGASYLAASVVSLAEAHPSGPAVPAGSPVAEGSVATVSAFTADSGPSESFRRPSSRSGDSSNEPPRESNAPKLPKWLKLPGKR